MSYLGTLTLRLAAGAMRLAEPVRRRHAAYLAGLQNADGGFSGRQGSSDPYYTGFALRGLALLGQLDDRTAGRAAGFLQQRLTADRPSNDLRMREGDSPVFAARKSGQSPSSAGPLAAGTTKWSGQGVRAPASSIDFLSIVYSAVLLEATHSVDVFAAAGKDRSQAVAAAVEPLRRADGGYAKTDRSGPSSTYHTFLVAACRQLVGLSLDQPERMAALVRSRQRSDGGFVELDQMQHSGANPTAAAVGLLRLVDALDESTSQRAGAFLARMQNAEGGLRANTRIPVADLLSTFTGLVALADVDSLAAVDLAAVQRYVAALERADGGFRGAAWDDAVDVEYTFYGLGTSALLAAVPA